MYGRKISVGDVVGTTMAALGAFKDGGTDHMILDDESRPTGERIDEIDCLFGPNWEVTGFYVKLYNGETFHCKVTKENT